MPVRAEAAGMRGGSRLGRPPRPEARLAPSQDQEAYAMAARSYDRTRRHVGEAGKVFAGKTPTAEAQYDAAQNRLIVGIRGTDSLHDMVTDASIPVGALASTARYKKDRAFVEALARKYPGARIEVSGHSLGGAIATQLKRDLPGLVTEARTFNQAVQPQDIVRSRQQQEADVKRSYMSSDPLYRTGGFAAANNSVVQGNSGHSLTGFQQAVGTAFDPRDVASAQPSSRGWGDRLKQGALKLGASAADAAANLTGSTAAARASNTLWGRYYGGAGRKRPRSAEPSAAAQALSLVRQHMGAQVAPGRQGNLAATALEHKASVRAFPHAQGPAQQDGQSIARDFSGAREYALLSQVLPDATEGKAVKRRAQEKREALLGRGRLGRPAPVVTGPGIEEVGRMEPEEEAEHEAYWSAKREKEGRERQARRYEELDRRAGLLPGTNAAFKKINDGLISAADMAAENLPLPHTVKSMYKTFGPPGSKFHGRGAVGHARGGQHDMARAAVGKASAHNAWNQAGYAAY